MRTPNRHSLTALLASFVLVLAGIVLVAGPARAATVSGVIDGVTYTADNSNVAAGATATAYDTASGPVVNIPGSVNLGGTDYAVKAIGESAFSIKNLTTVTFPDTLVTIGAQAFSSNQITQVTFPASLTTIGDFAFRYNALTSLTIPDTVTSMGQFAFKLNKLTSVSIGAGVTTLPNSVFAENLLTGVTIPDTLVTIGSQAFSSNQITQVTFPASLTTIGDFAFRYNALTSVTIPDTVTSMGQFAFSGNKLTSVSIGAGITTLPNSVFSDNLLTGVTIPDTVTWLGAVAFSDNKLATVSIGAGTTTIGAYAFYGNELTSVMIPAGVTSIAEYAFFQNPGLSSVRFLGPAPTVEPAGEHETFDTASGSLVLSYSPSFGEPATPGGYTTPLWKGYTTAPSASPVITGAATAAAIIDQPFSYTPTVTGNPAAAVSLSDGSLPAGLALNPTTGAITGTPTMLGTFPIALKASNGLLPDATLAVRITVAHELTGLTPTITGTVREGHTLTAHEGSVTPVTTTFTYQWKRNGSSITGANNPTYLLKKADAGRKISVTITASAPEQSAQTATSPETALVSSPYARIVVSRKTVKKGQPFTVTATGLKANQRYAIWLGGTKAYTGYADANGTVSRTVKFKYSTNYGTRRVRVSGYNSSGKRTYTIYTTVKYVR